MPSTNFCFPLLSVLENERVKLVPFDISVHPKLHVDAALPASFYDFLPVGPFQNEQELIASFWEKRIKNGTGETAFAIYDKSKSEHAYAGIITYKNTSVEDLVTEIGFLMILPEFQRTHVTSNAVGILMNYALNLPADGGLGLRRVVWTANASNAPSMATAKRLGFQMEGVLRWANAWPETKIRGSGGVRVRKEDPRAGEFTYGRNLAVLSVCWDDWEAGVKAKVNAEMARTQ
ncbi:acyl-CoA N-acyltransferase [Armillaria borealis]|uniref:Acyl-CoA N-acyltransferase n=1 Tax=Armillaria borealis TaxID=47425 RepID=A0AA39J169_9AGAR|nr:acyl-CoA N-acyltransferase [Armillaria borealis]